MAAFKFRLEALLRLRERIKDEKQWELGALNQARAGVETEIAALERQLRQMDDALEGRAGEFLSIIDLKLASESAQAIDRRIKEKRLAISQIDNAIVAKKGELVEARREVMALERLREHQAVKFRRQQDSVEQKFTDEVAQRKFATGNRRKNFPH